MVFPYSNVMSNGKRAKDKERRTWATNIFFHRFFLRGALNTFSFFFFFLSIFWYNTRFYSLLSHAANISHRQILYTINQTVNWWCLWMVVCNRVLNSNIYKFKQPLPVFILFLSVLFVALILCKSICVYMCACECLHGCSVFIYNAVNFVVVFWFFFFFLQQQIHAMHDPKRNLHIHSHKNYTHCTHAHMNKML